MAWGAIAGAAISGGLSLLGGNIARNTAKQSSGIDLAKLRRDAKANGFNPLTVLGATGGQGYQRVFNPALSSGAFINEAIQRGADTWFNQKAARDEEASYIRRREEEAAIQSARSHMSNPYRSFGYNLTDQRPFTPAVAVSAPALAAPARVKGNPNLVDGGDGLTRANPDQPPEAEADLWNWFRDGSLGGNLNELTERNFWTPEQRANKGKPFAQRNGLLQKAFRGVYRPTLSSRAGSPSRFDR